MASRSFIMGFAISKIVLEIIFDSYVGFNSYSQNFNVRRFLIEDHLQNRCRCGFPHGGIMLNVVE